MRPTAPVDGLGGVPRECGDGRKGRVFTSHWPTRLSGGVIVSHDSSQPGLAWEDISSKLAMWSDSSTMQSGLCCDSHYQDTTDTIPTVVDTTPALSQQPPEKLGSKSVRRSGRRPY